MTGATCRECDLLTGPNGPKDSDDVQLGNAEVIRITFGTLKSVRASSAECLQSLGIGVTLEYHGRPDFLTILGVRHAEGYRLSHRGMLQ